MYNEAKSLCALSVLWVVIRSQQAEDDRRKLTLLCTECFMTCKISCKSWELNPDAHKSVFPLWPEMELVPDVLVESSPGEAVAPGSQQCPGGQPPSGRAGAGAKGGRQGTRGSGSEVGEEEG